VTKTLKDSEGFYEWHTKVDRLMMKFDMHVQNPAVIFRQRNEDKSEFKLASNHFSALINRDNNYVDILRLDLSRVLPSAKGIQQTFDNFLHMSDMLNVSIEAILKFVEREKKDPNWLPTLVI
jgi:hypothetical protein